MSSLDRTFEMCPNRIRTCITIIILCTIIDQGDADWWSGDRKMNKKIRRGKKSNIIINTTRTAHKGIYNNIPLENLSNTHTRARARWSGIRVPVNYRFTFLLFLHGIIAWHINEVVRRTGQQIIQYDKSVGLVNLFRTHSR